MAKRTTKKSRKPSKYSSKVGKEYKRQRNRILKQFTRLEKRGYNVDRTVLPDVPEKISKRDVKQLAKIDVNKIYESSAYINKFTGETAQGMEARELEKEALTALKESDMIDYNAFEFDEDIDNFYVSDDFDYYDVFDEPTDFSIIDTVRELLGAIPSTITVSKRRDKSGEIDISTRTNALIGLFESIVESHEKDGTLGEYANYLASEPVQEHIDECIRFVYVELNSDRPFAELAEKLKGEPLSFAERFEIAELSDTVDNWTSEK